MLGKGDIMISKNEVLKGEIFKVPKKLGECVRIKDETHKYYNMIGYKQAVRIDDNKVLLYFPITKNKGILTEFNWEQCERI